jgi:hypothetical protein
MKKRHLVTMTVAVASLLVSTVVSVPSANAAEGTLGKILSRG